MYLEYYGLKEKPFTLSPNPKFLFYSHKHKEALSQIIYAATQRYGYMVLTGEVGTGKTTLINALLNCLPNEFNVAKIYHTVLSPKGLIQNICKEFGIEFANKTMAELVFKLQEYLKESFYAVKKSLLIVDEAQNLGYDILEEIRLLSNFEAAHEKFLQILLVGQLELENKLSNANLRHLRERINILFQLKRLDREETKNYIHHRLKVADCRNGENLFTDDAIEQIYKFSNGIPRRINMISDNALVMGYAKNVKVINDEIIEKVNFEDVSSEMEEVRQVKPSNKKSGLMVEAKEKVNVKKYVAVEKNGKLQYEDFEKFMGRFLYENKLAVVKKPPLRKILSAVILLFSLFLIVVLLAILLAQKLEILN